MNNYFKLIDRISGEIRECSFLQPLRELWIDLIQDYQRQGVETYVEYLGNGVYALKEYLIK